VPVTVSAGEPGRSRSAVERPPFAAAPVAQDRHVRSDVAEHVVNARTAPSPERPCLLALMRIGCRVCLAGGTTEGLVRNSDVSTLSQPSAACSSRVVPC
jgi:hypothetical protein